jgi:hypothetical protein
LDAEENRERMEMGAVKDEEAKIHPGLMPYDELPKSEALKNVACFFAHREAEDLWKVLQKKP